MQILGKPKNKWGRVRIAGIVVLAAVILWTLLAAALRGMGPVAWMLWSGYPAFSLQDGVELAIVPLMAVLVAGWLEEQDHRIETEQSTHRENEQAVAAQRKEQLKNFHEAVLLALGTPGSPEQVGLKIAELTRAALPQLDGKGKGELLHFLFEKGLLHGESPLVELRGTDFSGANLHKTQLKGIRLEGVNLSNAQLTGCHLVHGRFDGTDLSRAFLRHADLREAQLAGSNLTGAYLDGAALEGGDLRDANLADAFMMNTNLKNSTLNGFPVGDGQPQKIDVNGCPESLCQAVLIDTILPDGRKVTNEKGKEYLRNKDIARLVDRL